MYSEARGRRSDFLFGEESRQDGFLGFLHHGQHWAIFWFHTYVRTYVRVFSETTFAPSALGAQTTDTDENSSSVKSVRQPAAYSLVGHDVLYYSKLAAFIGPWHPA